MERERERKLERKRVREAVRETVRERDRENIDVIRDRVNIVKKVAAFTNDEVAFKEKKINIGLYSSLYAFICCLVKIHSSRTLAS